MREAFDKLLDNITPVNREHVDKRLNQSSKQRQWLETKLEELERLSMSQVEIDTIVTEGIQFISRLEFTLHNAQQVSFISISFF